MTWQMKGGDAVINSWILVFCAPAWLFGTPP